MKPWLEVALWALLGAVLLVPAVVVGVAALALVDMPRWAWSLAPDPKNEPRTLVVASVPPALLAISVAAILYFAPDGTLGGWLGSLAGVIDEGAQRLGAWIFEESAAGQFVVRWGFELVVWPTLLCVAASVSLGPVYLHTLEYPDLVLWPLRIYHERRSRRTEVLVQGTPLYTVRDDPAGAAQLRAAVKGAWYVGTELLSRAPWHLGDELLGHTWVVGEGDDHPCVMAAVRAMIFAGRPVVVIDGTGRYETGQTLWHWAREAGRQADLRYFGLGHSHERSGKTYSPLFYGDARELANKITAALEWPDAGTGQLCGELCEKVLGAFRATGKPFDLSDLLTAVSDADALGHVAGLLQAGPLRDELNRLRSSWTELQASTKPLRHQLRDLLQSPGGWALKAYAPEVDFYRAYRDRHLVYVSLSGSEKDRSATHLGRMMVGDLASVFARIEARVPEAKRGLMLAVFLDDRGSFLFSSIAGFAKKARAARVGLVLAHRDLARIMRVDDGERLKAAVASTNVKVCASEAKAKDAEAFASLLGPAVAASYVERGVSIAAAAGRGSDSTPTPATGPSVLAGAIGRLPAGHGAVVVGEPARAGLVRFDAPRPAVDGYWTPERASYAHANREAGLQLERLIEQRQANPYPIERTKPKKAAKPAAAAPAPASPPDEEDWFKG